MREWGARHDQDQERSFGENDIDVDKGPRGLEPVLMERRASRGKSWKGKLDV